MEIIQFDSYFLKMGWFNHQLDECSTKPLGINRHIVILVIFPFCNDRNETHRSPFFLVPLRIPFSGAWIPRLTMDPYGQCLLEMRRISIYKFTTVDGGNPAPRVMYKTL